MWCEMSDAVKYAKRCIITKIMQTPYNCLRPLFFCSAHRLHLITTKAVKEDECVGDVHAIAFVGQQPLKRQDLLSTGREIIDRELIVYHHPPPPEISEHVDRLLRHTLSRHEEMVRGRIVQSASTGRQYEALESKKNSATHSSTDSRAWA
jgi:hypothetical protein